MALQLLLGQRLLRQRGLHTGFGGQNLRLRAHHAGLRRFHLRFADNQRRGLFVHGLLLFVIVQFRHRVVELHGITDVEIQRLKTACRLRGDVEQTVRLKGASEIADVSQFALHDIRQRHRHRRHILRFHLLLLCQFLLDAIRDQSPKTNQHQNPDKQQEFFHNRRTTSLFICC